MPRGSCFKRQTDCARLRPHHRHLVPLSAFPNRLLPLIRLRHETVPLVKSLDGCEAAYSRSQRSQIERHVIGNFLTIVHKGGYGL